LEKTYELLISKVCKINHRFIATVAMPSYAALFHGIPVLGAWLGDGDGQCFHNPGSLTKVNSSLFH